MTDSSIRVTLTADGVVPGARYRATASDPDSADIVGTAAGNAPERARLRAVMEALERTTQFDAAPPGQFVARTSELPDALEPPLLGLYSAAQYARPGFPCRPYDPAERRAWVVVHDAASGAARALPSEFVFPRSVAAGALVRETSSGSAAAASTEAALDAALCELIERDALMRFWYRQVPARTVPRAAIDDACARADLDALTIQGFATTVIRLEAVVALPVLAVVAERAGRAAFGSAAAANPHAALRHALRECAESIACAAAEPARAPPLDVQHLRWPLDHRRLWQDEPYRTMLRAFLGATIAPTTSPARPVHGANRDAGGLLAGAGFRTFFHAAERRDGAHRASIVRALVPGLVPLHFGFGMERLGCARLSASTGEERLRTLLPHFFA